MGMMKTRVRARVGSAVVAIAVVGASLLVAQPAAADTVEPAARMTAQASVDGESVRTLRPADTFTYEAVVACFDAPFCETAQLRMSFPTELDGFAITGVVAPQPGVPHAIVQEGCGVDGAGIPNKVTADCRVGVDFTAVAGGGAQGLAEGESFALSVSLVVPVDLPFSWPGNRQNLANQVSATWSNGAPGLAQASAQVVVIVEGEIGLGLETRWDPPSLAARSDGYTKLWVTIENTSDVPATGLVIQQPAIAPDGAGRLRDDNVFRMLAPDVFALPTGRPPGTTSVTTELYVQDPQTMTWHWVTVGTGAEPTLGPDYAPETTAGWRLTFAGAVLAHTSTTFLAAASLRFFDIDTGTTLVVDDSVLAETSAHMVSERGGEALDRTATARFTVAPAAAVGGEEPVADGTAPGQIAATAPVPAGARELAESGSHTDVLALLAGAWLALVAGGVLLARRGRRQNGARG